MGNRQKPSWFWSAVFLLLIPLAWPHLFFKAQVPVDGNVLRLFYPNWTFLHAHPPALWSWPLWNPFRNMGEPFLADPQSLAAYPPMWLLCRLSSYLNFTRFWILGHSLLAAFFMRKWLFRVTQDDIASLAAAAVVTLNGFFMAHGTLLNHFASAAYVPAVFFFFEGANLAGLAAALALQWLAGFPPFSLLTGFALLAWALFANSSRRILLFRSVGVAIGLAAFQVLPFLELLHHSARPVLLNPAQAGIFFEPWRQLLRMLFIPQWYAFAPQLSGDQAVVSFYVGPIALLASSWAIWKGQKRERWIGGAVLMSLVLSVASWLPGLFRFPANWLLLSTTGLAFLSGTGIALIRNPRWKRLGASLIFVDLLVFAQYVRVPWFPAAYLTQPPVLAQQLVPLSGQSRIYHSRVMMQEEAGRELQRMSDYSFLKEALTPSYGMAFGLREVESYQVLKLRRAECFQRKLAVEGPTSALLRWAGISTVITRKPGSDSWGPQNIQVISIKTYNLPVFFSDGSKSARIDLSVHAPGKMVAMASTDKADRLVFSEIAYPGWRAFVDDQQVNLEVFEDTFLAVKFPPGRHKIVFDYRPLTFWAGFWISLGAAILFGGVLIHRVKPVSRLRDPSPT